MMTIRCVLVALLATAAVAAPAPDCPVTDCLLSCPDGVYMKDGCPTCDCITDVEFCTVALCPTGTLCDNDRRECVPFACSLPVCEEECEYGFIFDDAGCPLCECAPDPCEDANCPTGTGCVVRLIAVQCIRAPCPSIYQAECVDPNVLKDGSCPPNDVIGICVVPDNACIGDGQCPGDEKCCSSGCNRVCLPPVKDEDCEELECLEEARETCPNGVVTVFGCPTCQCQDEAPFCTRALCPVGTRCDDTLQACVPLEACPPVCAVFCEFGKVLDANGCETCECNPDPCRTMTCEPGTVCTTRVISVACIWGPCPPQVISSCVDPAPRAGDCPAFLFPPCAESLNQCTYDAECDKPDSKCCQDQCGATRCTAPAPACGTLNCHVSCEYGVLYDDIGCPTCDCYDPCENVQCEAGETCEGFYTPCPAGTPPQFCRPVGSCVHRCSELMCDLACPEGLSFKKDEYGCDICDCCPALDCSEACPYGHARDPQGCETCRCSNPCEVVKCGSGTQCVVIRVDIVCITTPCDPQFHAECVDSTPKPGDCPVLLSRRPCIDPNAVDECTLDTQCRGTYKCCDDGVCGVLRCQPPVLDCEDLDCLADIRERCPLGVVVRDGCPTCECLEETPFCAVALCIVGTVCDEERRACVPIECPPAICLVACEFGSDPDARGCPSCDCLPDPCQTVDCKPDAVCVARPVDVGCATGSHCPVVYQAMCLDPNEKPGTCPVIFSRRVCTEPEPRDECSTDSGCRGDYKCCHDNICGVLKCMEPVVQCPQVRCSSKCPAGYIHDKDGCQTCECENLCALIDCAPGYRCDPDVGDCVPEECEPELCEMWCEFGFALDENGCEFCQCRIDPCATVRCGFGTVCVARRVDVLCKRAPCPPQFEVSCVDPASKPGSCPTVFSLRPCTEPNAVAECVYDTECRGDYKCCDDGICGVMRCTAPQVSCRPLRCPACRAGHVMVDGCPTCECINPCAAIDCAPGYTCDENTGQCEQVGPRCPPVRCDATCRLTLDENDCEICSCSRDPCATQICRRNYHCEVTRGDQTRCVRDRHCQFPTIPDSIYDMLAQVMAINHRCQGDSECSSSQKCCDSLEGRACSAELTTRPSTSLSRILRLILGGLGSRRRPSV